MSLAARYPELRTLQRSILLHSPLPTTPSSERINEGGMSQTVVTDTFISTGFSKRSDRTGEQL
jgi:hypothetical protein